MVKHLFQVGCQKDKLLVYTLLRGTKDWGEGANGDTVVELGPKGQYGVVDDDHVFQGSILDDPEILEKQALLNFKAVLPVEHSRSRKIFAIRIYLG